MQQTKSIAKVTPMEAKTITAIFTLRSKFSFSSYFKKGTNKIKLQLKDTEIQGEIFNSKKQDHGLFTEAKE